MALAPAERARLARLMGMTGSVHDGEAPNALRLAQRLLGECNATWADVLSETIPAPAPAATAAVRYWKHAAEDVLFNHSGALNDWEITFLQDILSRGFRLSEKQERALRRIADKTGVPTW